MASGFTLKTLALLAVALPPTIADGTGILGYGKWLYKPLCAHTCRYLLAKNPLPCQTQGNDAATGSHSNHSANSDVHCWLTDETFLKSVALCIEDYCPWETPDLSTIERWWAGHLATGSIGDWSEGMRPALSYGQAARLANIDVEEMGDGGIPFIAEEEQLNVTSRLAEDFYLPTYNYQKAFQWGEFDHGTNSLVISITSVGLPIFLSMFRFLPGWHRRTSRMNAILDQPLWGHHHRVPAWKNMGYVPTRGQSIIIAYLVIINVVLMCLPVRTLQPNSRMESHHMQRVQVIGDRAGVLAFCLYVSLFLFSTRNNILIWITGWSHGTFLLLHRWIAYICIFQTVMHSILMLHYFVQWGDHAAESQLPYWYWGIISTLATCLMYPLSILPIRQRVYQIFLATHQVLAALVLITAFLHIWYLFEWDWGYEIWVYVAGAIWFSDRALRLIRIAFNGLRTAKVSVIATDSDLMRIEIDGIVAYGHAYLYFPTLTWRIWENHPFSILSTNGPSPYVSSMERTDDEVRENHVQDISESSAKDGMAGTVGDKAKSSASSDEGAPGVLTVGPIGPRTTFLIRPQTGLTANLLSKARSHSAGGNLSLPVLVESSYHSNPTLGQLSTCSTLIAIAGGVGITAVLPVVRSFPGLRTHLRWGVRHRDIVAAIQPELSALGPSADVDVSVGARIPIGDVLRDELLRDNDKGEVAVLVCGPPEMADDVRKCLGELVATGKAKRHVVFIDEAFCW